MSTAGNKGARRLSFWKRCLPWWFSKMVRTLRRYDRSQRSESRGNAQHFSARIQLSCTAADRRGRGRKEVNAVGKLLIVVTRDGEWPCSSDDC